MNCDICTAVEYSNDWYIASLIKQGFNGGYYPYWRMTCVDVGAHELSDHSRDHIAQLVQEGYRACEIIEQKNYNLEIKRGWWTIEKEGGIKSLPYSYCI